MSNETADDSVVSKPMGGLYAGPVPGSTPKVSAKIRPFRYDPDAEISPPVTAAIPKDNKPQPAPNLAGHRVCGEYDGHVTVGFKAGNGYDHSFSFDLPNVIGNLGVAGINDVAITEMIERALVDKLGRGGVARAIRHESE